ncbi:MAG: TolC family protein [Planctomycetota bacterium]|nr:TolC family protein [Planctomycetota bacterium]
MLPACALITGCQTYEPAPIDIEAHRASIDHRLDDAEPLIEFSRRIAEGDEAPDRFDLSDGVALAEGEVLALFYNADLRLARLRAGLALADYETAGLWNDPEFGFDGAEILSPSGSPFEFGLRLNVTIPISGRLAVERERASAAYESELRRIVDAEWAMRARVRSAWAAWTAESNRLGLLRQTVAQTERVVDIADRLESAGELTRVEARLLRAALVEARAGVAQAERGEASARIELLGLMGLAPDAGVRLSPSLSPPDLRVEGDPVRRLIEANTTLAVRRAEYQVAEETLRLEIRKQYPDITVGAGYGSEDDDRLLLGASMPIPILNANRAGIATARADREIARANAEIAFEQLSRELANALAQHAAAKTQRRAFEEELIPMFYEQTLEVARLADLGEVDTFVLLESVTQTYSAKSRLLDLRVAEITSAHTVIRLLGPDFVLAPAPVAESRHPNAAGPAGREPVEEIHP